ncbi:MAG: ribonuclease P protein component, partial [Alphaproteobacteria bacterium]|nr:ribonuclease P protein component [Alphaproteobacteria bacterium]
NVGFVVTKKGISKKAVVRNLVKRRLREVARAVLSEMGETGKVYVFYARQEAETGDFSGMKEALKKCLNSLS